MSSVDFTITNKSKTVQFDVHSRRGLKGDTGATGDSAYQAWLDLGNTGDEAAFVASLKGAQGDQGIQGIQGEKGDKGDTGDTGATGAKGDKGDTGAQGVQGIQGEQGLQGIQGIQGEKGDKGDTGAQGDPGVVQSVNGQSVANVVLDHTDVGADQAGAAAAAQVAAELHADIAVSNLNQSLGSAAFSDDSDFATAAQGALADTAVQIESDPTVPSWAKVGTQPFETGAQVNTVTSVNTRTGAVTGLAEASDLTAHTSNTTNPHSVTKAQVGLGNVDNTSDANKPVSTAQQTALDAKENVANKSASTTLGTSDTLYPTQNAVKTYVDTQNTTRDYNSLLRLPVMTITLDGLTDPTNTEDYILGTYTITDTEKGILHSGATELRGRGNSTFGAAKKPWRIKFDKKTAPLGMTANQKNWALLAMWYDASQVSNALAFTLGQGLSGLDWTPQYRYVELVLNNTYRGIYQLTDLVRLEEGRLPGAAVSGDTGSGVTGTWLMEITNKERPGNVIGVTPEPGFFTPTYNQWIIYDDPEAPTAAQESYIQTYIANFELALAAKDGSWKNYADANSFADWWLINELLRNGDTTGYWSSCKIWKQKDGLLKMGPLWDHDLGLGRTFSTDDIETNTLYTGWHTRSAAWITQMWNTDVQFREIVKVRWQALLDRLDAMGGVEKWIDDTLGYISRAIKDDQVRWPTKYTVYTKYIAQNADFRKRWVRNRINWITTEFNNASTNTYTAIYTDEY